MRIIKCRVGEYQTLCATVPGFVYCGRAFRDYPASVLGNPYPVGNDPEKHYTSRESLRLYRHWLWDHIRLEDEVFYALKSLTEDSVLGCWCVEDDQPEDCLKGCETCHCHIVVKAAIYLASQNT